MIRSLMVFASLVAVVSLTAGAACAEPAEPRDGKATRQRGTAPPPKSVARPRPATSCAEFGAGFVRAPGSDTCVRIGGGVGVGVGF